MHHVRTPRGVIRAKAVAFATGGYTRNDMHRTLSAKIMPILSNSLVTRPLTQEEIASTKFRTRQVITDTRTLRFYYRLLPDNRVQIGSRSAITGADAANPRHMDVLIEGLHRKFPSLKGIRIDYSWWGWVDVSHDMMPRVAQPDPQQSIFYAVGYGGNGVSFSAHAGRRMAERVAGKWQREPRRSADLRLRARISERDGHGAMERLRAVPPRRSTISVSQVSGAGREALNPAAYPFATH